jgi:hypothetical protein
MLKELNKVKGEPSTINVINKDIVTVETCSSNSEATSDEEINKLEKAFGNIQRITSRKPNPTTFTKNWYPRPTPPDMQFEERGFQHQFSVSVDKLYEWNIDGLSEQEVLNKLSHLTMVANSYMTNHQLNHIEIIDLLATGLSGKLKSWWEKHLTEESRELIKNSVKRDEEGNLLFDERIGMGIPDGVNTLVFTIIRHFIGQPSNITSRIHDQLSNLKCPTMSDFRWYEDVFTSRVMLRVDSNKPFWKEKFIDGLPNLFAHKIRTVLSNSNGIIDYDTLTYGDIISTIKQEGLKMCIEQRIAKQQYDNKRKAKYEMGNFCEQYGILSVAPSQRKYIKHKKEKYNKQGRIWKKKKNFQPNEYYNKNKKFSKKSNKNYKRYDNKKFDKKKTKCFKCGKYGHFANDCKVKQKITQLQINDKEKEELYNLLELRNTDSENEISPDEIESSSDEYSSSSSSTPEIKFGCTDNCCADKRINVISKQEEQEELLLEAISKINDPELKASMLHKLRKMLNKKDEVKDNKLPKPTISLSETLERFNKLKPKKVSLEDSQLEIKKIKQEIIQLKDVNKQLEDKNLKLENKNTKLEDRVSILELDKIFKPLNNHESSSKDEQPESSHRRLNKSDDEIRYCNLLNKISPVRWHTNVKLIIDDFEVEVIVLVDTGTNLNCIQEGLIPTKYFEKSFEQLNSANGSKMHIKYEINNAHICKDKVCFKQSFVLVKNMSDKVILGFPFIHLLLPFTTDVDGITTAPFGQPVKFEFLQQFEENDIKMLQDNLISQSNCLIQNKEKQIKFLKDEIHHQRIEQQLNCEILQHKIDKFQNKLNQEVCSSLPNAFWNRKTHFVKLPYIKDFNERNIPTKAKPIQMNQEIMEFCKNEINDLLEKKIIRHSKSPWSCPAFYV